VKKANAEGKIKADEAERLLAALGEGDPAACCDTAGGRKPKYLCVKVNCEPGSHHRHGNVDIKIPILLLKAGVKLGSLLPEESRARFKSHFAEKGLNFDLGNLDVKNIDAFLDALSQDAIDIDGEKEKVRIFCC
jgi:hypothetical protein